MRVSLPDSATAKHSGGSRRLLREADDPRVKFKILGSAKATPTYNISYMPEREGSIRLCSSTHDRGQHDCGKAVKVDFLAWSRGQGTLQSSNLWSQKVKGSRPKFGYGQAVKANCGGSKFLTAVGGGTTWSIEVTTLCPWHPGIPLWICY